MTYRTLLVSPHSRQRAKDLIDKAEHGWVATLAEPRRTNAQSDKMWAMLSDISKAEPGGEKYTPDEWKPRIMHACGWECQFLPGILDGRPFPVGFRSSQMSRKQMSAMIDWMQAWGDEMGVQWSDNQQEEAA